jgi:hypothetical protein
MKVLYPYTPMAAKAVRFGDTGDKDCSVRRAELVNLFTQPWKPESYTRVTVNQAAMETMRLQFPMDLIALQASHQILPLPQPGVLAMNPLLVLGMGLKNKGIAKFLLNDVNLAEVKTRAPKLYDAMTTAGPAQGDKLTKFVEQARRQLGEFPGSTMFQVVHTLRDKSSSYKLDTESGQVTFTD